MNLLFLLFQTAAATPSPSREALERQPALLSIIYMAGLGLMALLLLVSIFRNRRRRTGLSGVAPEDLPDEVRQRLGSTSTNRGLRILRWLFTALAISIFGFHVYWAQYAKAKNEAFLQLSQSNKDKRNLRLRQGSLRNWFLDRNREPLAYYQKDSSGNLVRVYKMDEALSHLFGTEFGNPGLESVSFSSNSGDTPEAWEILMGNTPALPPNPDIRLTIDARLQDEAVKLLKAEHKAGAVVVLNPQTGAVLAMYSEPSFSLKAVQSEEAWRKLDADKENRPLVSRARDAYYTPGSTFKTLTMIVAFLSGKQEQTFQGTPGGYFEKGFPKPITDDNGSCEGPICGEVDIARAYQYSSNQFFSQMGVFLGVQSYKRFAPLVGVGVYDTPVQALQGRKRPDLVNASTAAIKRVLAPTESTMVGGPKTTRFELAQEGYGQGEAGQMTPLQMAMIASSVANLNGQLMKLKFEEDRPPEVFQQVVSREQAARIREIMGLVPSAGTGRGAFAAVNAAGITSGGKTGTAQKEIPLYDKDGNPVMEQREEKDPKGTIIRVYQVQKLQQEKRKDSWYLSIAPLDNPQLAIAVIVEDGGYGARTAAPIAAKLVLKANELGLLGKPAQPQKNVKADRPK